MSIYVFIYNYYSPPSLYVLFLCIFEVLMILMILSHFDDFMLKLPKMTKMM